jgi:hemin uptake protein HemP
MDDSERRPVDPPPKAPHHEGPTTVTSEQLLQGRRELLIDHEGEIYRLRITSRGKLYLTK